MATEVARGARLAATDPRASPLGAGHARGGQVETGTLSWPQAGLIIFSFAAPSACIGVAYSVAMAGLLGGPLICLLLTAASVGGSLMLLTMRLTYRDAYTLGDLGFKVLGPAGKVWGNTIQLGNFLLFLPVALLLCATALQGIVDIPAFQDCADYYIFSIAIVCLFTTQFRTLKNTQLLSAISAVCVFGMAALQIVAAMKYENKNKKEALWFGNPDSSYWKGFSEALLGTTTAAWAYVPAFLTVELATVMRQPTNLKKSLYLSGLLNICVFIGVGVVVVWKWGYEVADPITLSQAWHTDDWINTALNSCALLGNFVSYMLDSVPLGRYCQRVWMPAFSDMWNGKDIGMYLVCTLPTFLFGLFLSIAVPNLFVLLAFTTALTIPWVTQIYPATLYWKYIHLTESSAAILHEHQHGSPKRASTLEKAGVVAVFLIGVVSFIVCLAAAIGKVSIAELRGPCQIGCPGWIIWKSD
mmetsp:Transcript_63786/g.134354  ORF Transcript_63786/g.134354 Transcript_63786/m.134354 type:complete len:471 (+) Transcript_63786:276-1688(+)